MKPMKKKLIVALSATALGMTAAAGLAKQGWADDSASQIPTTGEKLAGAPDTATLPWGTFTLNPRIAALSAAGARRRSSQSDTEVRPNLAATALSQRSSASLNSATSSFNNLPTAANATGLM